MPIKSTWSGSSSIRGSTESIRMILLTFSGIGLTITWGIEMTYCTPYLLKLGLSKSKTSLVWIAGPLSGLIMVPVIGAISDRSTSRWGRRRPFMVWGSIAVILALIVLGWIEEIVALFVPQGDLRANATLFGAVLSIYAIDFAINAVGACSRSLIIDCLPASQQQMGSAWATRMGAAAQILGYFLGSLDMVQIFGNAFGGTQFKSMIVIAIVSLLISTSVTCAAITERRLLSTSNNVSQSSLHILKDLCHRTVNLPARVQQICWIQFWSWIGWFPFLFYSSVWVGEVYYQSDYGASHAASDSHDALGNVGRLGSLSLVIMSVVQFTASMVLPRLIQASRGRESSLPFTPRPPKRLSSRLYSTVLFATQCRPSLVTAWMIGELFYAIIMIPAPLITSPKLVMACVAVAGVPWCITGWAPFSELGIEVNRMADLEGESSPVRTSLQAHALHNDKILELDEIDVEREGLHRTRSSETLDQSESSKDAIKDSGTSELAGIYLGVLNVYTTLPQFVGTFISCIVFSLLEPDNGDVSDEAPDHHKWLDVRNDKPNAIAVCLCIGACSAIVAAEAARRLRAQDGELTAFQKRQLVSD